MRATATTATVTMLFTDVVGSTELSSRLGDDGSEALRQAHFGALREAVTTHNGDEVKTTGDGLMVAFASAFDALSCAVAMQQAVARRNRRDPARALAIRVGLSSGDVTREGGDFYGTPVVEAARLCDAAEGGQILVSDLVRALAGSRGAHVYVSVGALALKGLPEPLAASEVDWVGAGGARLPLPPMLASVERTFFVGREPELEQLTSAWKRAATGQRRAVLLAGEPGMGKTRLATELALAAHDEGATVLWGRCDEDLGLAYQPFAEALRHYVLAGPLDDLTTHVADFGGELARLVPELHRRLPDVPPPLKAEPEVERYRVFEAVAGLLAVASETAPVVVVLDDLHWAAKPTLLLLRHLLRAPEPASLLVVGTYRDTELDRAHPLSEVLADLRREPVVDRLALAGLDEAGVAAYVEAAAGHSLDDATRAVARAVHAETEGNPFFVGQVLRHLAESGAIYQRDGRWVSDLAVEQLGIPEGVREVIGRRLSRLSKPANRVLAVASVAGRDFDLRVVERVVDLPAADVLDALEEAVGARLVAEVPNAIDRYTFTHALVRETLYGELSTSRRVRLHRAIGEVLESLHPGGPGPRLAELAYHFGEAAEGGDVGKAVDYARRAGDRAMEQVGYEEAARHYERALEAVDLKQPADDALRCQLLTALGQAQLGSGDSRRALETCDEAVQAARRTRSAELLARAALGRDDARFVAGDFTEAADSLLEALAALGDDDHHLRALVAARLPRAGVFKASLDEKRAWARLASDAAEASGDIGARAAALSGMRWALTDPRFREQQLEVSQQLVRVAEQAGDKALAHMGHVWCVVGFLELGDLAAADREIEALDRLSDELHDPFSRWFPIGHRATRATLEGRFEEAERLAAEALSVGQRMNSDWAIAQFVSQLFTLRRAQGRLAELEVPARDGVERFPQVTVNRCALADILVESGRTEEAKLEFERLAENDFARLPRDGNWLVAVHLLSEVCGALGDSRRAAVLYEFLLPYAGRTLVVEPGTACTGSASRNLGVLATTMGRYDEAEAHFEAAVAFNARMGARPWLAHTQCDYAAMLRTRGRSGDREKATRLLSEALATADELGMARVAERARLG